MIIIYRLSHKSVLNEYPNPFRPKQTDNRWNSSLSQVAYSSEHLALAAIELLSYWQNFASLQGYKIFSYQLKNSQITELKDITAKPDYLDKRKTQEIGDKWTLGKSSLALKVPSVVMPYSYNYLINPNHSDFNSSNIKDLGDFYYEKRIIKLIAGAKNGKA